MNEYTTVNGDVIKLRPMSSKVRDILSAKYVVPDPPTYEVENVAGDIELHPLDETSLETDEDRADWEAYQKELAAANEKYSELVVQTYVKFGTNYLEFSPPNNDWADLQEEYGLKVPTEPKERQMYYFCTEILSSDSDLRNVMANIRALSSQGRMLSVEEAEASFRSAVEDRSEDESGQDDDDTVDTVEGSEVESGSVGS